MPYRTAFISHAHADNALCDPFAAALRARGVTVFHDRTTPQVGQPLGAALERELIRANTLIVLVTPLSLASFWVQQEIDMFMALMAREPDEDRRLVPVRLVACELPPRLAARWWVDAVDKDTPGVVAEVLAGLTSSDPVRSSAAQSTSSAPPAPTRSRRARGRAGRDHEERPGYTVGIEMANDQVRAGLLPLSAVGLPTLDLDANSDLVGVNGLQWSFEEVVEALRAADPGPLLDALDAVVDATVTSAAASQGGRPVDVSQIRGVTIAVPMRVDQQARCLPTRGIEATLSPGRFWGPVRAHLQRRWAADATVQVSLAPMGRLGALAELYRERARRVTFARGGATTLLYVHVSTDVDIGIVVDDVVPHGAHGLAGTGGHLPLANAQKGPTCPGCGQRCLTALASGRTLAMNVVGERPSGLHQEMIDAIFQASTITPTDDAGGRIRACPPSVWAGPVDARAILRAVEAKEAKGRDLPHVPFGEHVQALYEHLGEGVGMLVDLIDPDNIILGGIVAVDRRIPFIVRDKVERRWRGHVASNPPPIHASAYGDRACLVGAALHAANYDARSEIRMFRQ